VPAGIHVVHPTGSAPYLATADGGQLLLRGVDSNALVQYSDQPGCAFQETVPLTRSGLAEMAALGFDFLRLAVSWSRIEPAPGVLASRYLGHIHRIVEEARAYGIAVLVDLHQDRYNRHLWCGQEVDGAPDWATVTAGAPCTPIAISTLCAQVAAQAFWSDAPAAGQELQQWYLRALAQTVGGEPNLAGLELMNEPTPGLVGPGAFELSELYPFYRRMISGLRASGFQAPIWFEPSVLRDTTDDALPEAARFSDDPQLVYAVHIYTGVFSSPPGPDNSELQLAQSYRNAASEARVFGTPWVDDEFGSDASSAWDGWLARQLALQNWFVVGSGFWVWQQQPGFYGWSVVYTNGTLRTHTKRAQLLSLPHVDVVPGRLLGTELTGPLSGGARRLRATVQSPAGGTAVLWSGTAVEAGGYSLLSAPRRRVTVDGRPVPARCVPARFARQTSTSRLVLTGCRIEVWVPPGRHTVALQP
jgi:hypothetical protein